jgi:hypothetical protein
MLSFNKRILLVNDQFNYLSSGGCWRTRNLAEGLNYLKYDVRLVIPYLKFKGVACYYEFINKK